MSWLAMDIGGANLKFADGNGYAQSYSFPLWREWPNLAQKLRMAIAEAPPCSHLAVTMTGELADCFETKFAGVKYILQAVFEASDGRHTRVYLTDGRMVSPAVAQRYPLLAASSNWHALARLVGRLAETGPALLIDIGSTTTDIIPLVDGQPVAAGRTDTQRLLSGELVYTGVERSPVCALIDSAPYRGHQCPVAQEVFATTGDVYVILGDLPEDSAKTTTPDGRPATKKAARIRLGRMISADDDQFNHRDAVAIAHAVADAQMLMVATAVKRVIAEMPNQPMSVILAGHGEFLARRVVEHVGLESNMISLARLLGLAVSRCATAHALAVLAQEAPSP